MVFRWVAGCALAATLFGINLAHATVFKLETTGSVAFSDHSRSNIGVSEPFRLTFNVDDQQAGSPGTPFVSSPLINSTQTKSFVVTDARVEFLKTNTTISYGTGTMVVQSSARPADFFFDYAVTAPGFTLINGTDPSPVERAPTVASVVGVRSTRSPIVDFTTTGASGPLGECQTGFCSVFTRDTQTSVSIIGGSTGPDPTVVPVPASGLLLVGALAALGLRRRKA